MHHVSGIPYIFVNRRHVGAHYLEQMDVDVVLPNGVKMPQLGLGLSHRGGCGYSHEAVVHALKHCGVRLLDTAERYGNMAKLPAAIQESGIAPEKVFITTKLYPSNYTRVHSSFEDDRRQLNKDVIDLFLLHTPDCGIGAGNKNLRLQAWRELEELYDRGQCRAIGVSNFMEKHLVELLEECSIKPMANQCEFHPFQTQNDLRKFCTKENIVFQGYSPLAKGGVMHNDVMKEMSQKYKKTPAQVAIKWSLQHGYVTIPKSTKPDRVKENCDVFDFVLSDSDIAKLHTLHDGRHVSWDPTGVL